VRPKVDQRAGLLSLRHLGNFRRSLHSPHLPLPRKHSPEIVSNIVEKKRRLVVEVESLASSWKKLRRVDVKA